MYKVLLVDDEERVTQGMSRFVPWEEMGFAVAGAATSVARALVFIESNPIDLVITDIQMPVQNGLELIRLLRPQYPHMKFVILSAYSEFAYAQEALRLGAFDYLTKPINFAQMKALLLKVHKRLDEERQREEIDDMQELLARTLVMNFANGYPYDAAKASACLNTQCAIAVARIMALSRQEAALPNGLASTIESAFKPGRVFKLSAQELLAVIETTDGCEAFAEKIEQAIGCMPLCVGIDVAPEGYPAMRKAFLQAGKAMCYQSARESAGVMAYEQISRLFAGAADRQETLLHSLTQLLSAPEKRRQFLPAFDNAILDMAEQPGFSFAKAQQFCTALVLELDIPIQSFSIPNYPRHIRLNDILLTIWSSTELPELRAAMNEYFRAILKRLDELNETAFTGELISRVQSYIQEHFAEELTLNVLAERFYVSPSYLSRLFKKKTGVNFIDYLTGYRLEKAKEYLTKTSRKVYHISEMIGYENPRYFSRLFKEATGCTPQEYRSRFQREGL